jgi:hypothetical protein
MQRWKFGFAPGFTLRSRSAVVALSVSLAACAASGGTGPGDDGAASTDEPSGDDGALRTAPIAAALPSGALQAPVVEIASASGLLSAVTGNDNVYIHVQSEHAWYVKSGNYLLGVESFTQYHQELGGWVDLGSGDKVAPAQTRVVGLSPDGRGWQIPSLGASGQWPDRANSVWVIGTESGRFGMGGAPQGIPLGTEVFGSMQTYGGAISTPYLLADGSTHHDSDRIRAAFAFNTTTVLGGHSAGSSAARRIALDLGLSHVWLYGTPNYSRGSGAYTQTETSGHLTMVAEVINNVDDPVTNVLIFPLKLVSLAWGTAKCHDYSHWDYQATSPVVAVCH